MNNIVIVSYNCDELGNYFQLCNADLQQYIIDTSLSIAVHCEHNNCDREILHDKLKEFDDDYIVSIYAHGEEENYIKRTKNRIRTNKNEDLINIENAMHSYTNAIVYSTSCYAANELGETMHLYGCKLFFGYKAKSYLSLLYKDDFIEMDNFTLKLILDAEIIDGRELYKKTNKFLTDKIKEMRTKNPLVAPLIIHNREAFTIYHNKIVYPN